MTMRYKFLGNTGIKVSELCLGTMTFGDKWGNGANEAESLEVAAAYADAGGNFLDTANKYHEGQSEEICGKIIAGNRDRWVLATKYTLSMGSGDPNTAGNSRKNMMQSVHASLKRLGTDYIDLYWVHAWDFTTAVEEVMRGLDDLVRSGKVLSIGVSDTPAWIVSQANTIANFRGWTPFAALQLEYSLIERTVERDLMPMARSLGLTVTPWGPLGGGVLTGKYSRASGTPEDSKRAAGNARRLSDRNMKIAKEVDIVADELGKTSTQVAMNWLRGRGAEVLPIFGARKISQIQDILGAVDFTLSPEHMKRLNDVSAIELGFPHDFLGANQFIRTLVYSDRVEQIDLPSAVTTR
jgi:aryl-alcohol dehydrogenase-like predicted oxidoreductase